MADVDVAFTFVMKNEDPKLEGVVVPEPNGAKARFGVNSLAHPEAITDGFYEMSKEDAWEYAKNIFTKDYWNPICAELLTSQLVANKWVDLVYNIYVPEGVKVMQRAVNSLSPSDTIAVDGMAGIQTLNKLNSVDPTALLVAFKSYGKQYYQDVVSKNPTLAEYKDGWIERLDA